MRRLWASGPVLLTIAMLFWAGSVVTGRAATPLVPPALFTLLRWAGALAIALPFAWRHLWRDRRALASRWWVMGLLAVFGVATYNTFMYRGLRETTAVNALLLQSATPLLTLVAAFAIFRERPSRRQAVAILVSVLGVVVIAGEGSVETLRHMRFNPGDGLVLIAVTGYAVYGPVLRLRPAVHPMSLLTASIAIGVALLVPFAVMEFREGARLVPTPLSLGCIAYACVFPALLSSLFYNRGVELVGAARAGQFSHLMPVFGLLMAIAFLGERLHAFHGVGMALIGAGLWLADGRSGPDGGVTRHAPGVDAGVARAGQAPAT